MYFLILFYKLRQLIYLYFDAINSMEEFLAL